MFDVLVLIHISLENFECKSYVIYGFDIWIPFLFLISFFVHCFFFFVSFLLLYDLINLMYKRLLRRCSYQNKVKVIQIIKEHLQRQHKEKNNGNSERSKTECFIMKNYNCTRLSMCKHCLPKTKNKCSMSAQKAIYIFALHNVHARKP